MSSVDDDKEKLVPKGDNSGLPSGGLDEENEPDHEKQVIRFKIWEELITLINPPLYVSPNNGTQCLWFFWMTIQILLGLILFLLMCVVLGILPENHPPCLDLGHEGCRGSGVAFAIFTIVMVFGRLLQFTYHLYRLKYGIPILASSIDDKSQIHSDLDNNHPRNDNNQAPSELSSLTVSLLFSLITTTATFQLAHLNRLQLSLTNSTDTTLDIEYIWPWQSDYAMHVVGFVLELFAGLSSLIDYTLIAIVLLSFCSNSLFYPFNCTCCKCVCGKMKFDLSTSIEKNQITLYNLCPRKFCPSSHLFVCTTKFCLPSHLFVCNCRIMVVILIIFIFPKWHFCSLFSNRCNEISFVKGIEIGTHLLNLLLVTVVLIFIVFKRFDPHLKALGRTWQKRFCIYFFCFIAFNSITLCSFVIYLFFSVLVNVVVTSLFYILMMLGVVGIFFSLVHCGAFVSLNAKQEYDLSFMV